ncbi:hypothetical protein HK097_011126, partial [Rhizophlyctis rosea]
MFHQLAMYFKLIKAKLAQVDPSGAIKKDLKLGLDVKIDPSGSIKLDPGLGIDTRLSPNDVPGLDVRVDEVSIQKTLGQLRVNLSETDRGLQQLADGLDDSCLSKTTRGLEVTVAPDSPFVKELLGLDIKVGSTLKKTLVGLEGNYVGKTPDITVSDVEEKLDKVDDLAENLDNAIDNLDDLGDRLDNVAENLSNIAEQVMSTAAQIGTAAAAGAVEGGISSGLALTAAGKLAKDGVQSLISANAAKVIGGGLAAASLAGILGGLLGSLGSKKTYNTYIIGDQGVSNSGVIEDFTDDHRSHARDIITTCSIHEPLH